MLDLLFKNISIVDGSGKPARVGDIGVRDGKITFVVNDSAKETVNGSGLTLCPGFIDSHSHGDFSIGFYPATICKVCQGVTSEVGGQCGDSTFPTDKRHLEELKLFANIAQDYMRMPYDTFTDFKAYKEYGDKCGLVMNMASLVGHNTLRISVMGADNRAPSPEELELMKSRLVECVKQGAVGLSTGLVYIPGAYAEIDELVELCRAMAPYGGIYATHMRNESDEVLESVKESIYIAEQAGVPLVISHFKIKGCSNWGKSEEAYRMIDEARARGVKIMCDLYPYDACMSGVSVCIPPQYFSDGLDALMKKLADPVIRKQIAEEMNDPNCSYDNFYQSCGGFGGVYITSSPSVPEAEGMTVLDYANKIGKDPMDCFLDLLIENKGVYNGIFFSMDEKEVERIYCDEHSVVGTDGLCLDDKKKGHPRTWTSFVRTLTYYAGEKGLVSFEEAIKKQTSQTAEFWGLKNKGLIAEGYDADLVLIDRSALKSVADYQNPNEKPEGIKAVYVGGECVYTNKELTGVKKGQIIKCNQ